MNPDQYQRLLIAVSQIDALCREAWEMRDGSHQAIHQALLGALTELHLAITLCNNHDSDGD